MMATQELIGALWSRLNDPTPPKRNFEALMQRRLDEVRSGWVGRTYIEDVLYGLGLNGGLDDEIIALAGVTPQSAFSRPTRRQRDCMGFLSLRDVDFTAVLIYFERLGLPIDPSPFVDLLLPNIRKRKMLCSSELHILWYGQERHRFEVYLNLANPPSQALNHHAIKTPLGYRVIAMTDGSGVACSLSVQGKNYRLPRRQHAGMF